MIMAQTHLGLVNPRLDPFGSFSQETNRGRNPPVEIRQMELFVGSVHSIVRQPETHHYSGDAERFLEETHRRHRSAGTQEHRLIAEALSIGDSSCGEGGVPAAQERRPGVEELPNREAHCRWRDASNVIAKLM